MIEEQNKKIFRFLNIICGGTLLVIILLVIFLGKEFLDLKERTKDIYGENITIMDAIGYIISPSDEKRLFVSPNDIETTRDNPHTMVKHNNMRLEKALQLTWEDPSVQVILKRRGNKIEPVIDTTNTSTIPTVTFFWEDQDTTKEDYGIFGAQYNFSFLSRVMKYGGCKKEILARITYALHICANDIGKFGGLKRKNLEIRIRGLLSLRYQILKTFPDTLEFTPKWNKGWPDTLKFIDNKDVEWPDTLKFILNDDKEFPNILKLTPEWNKEWPDTLKFVDNESFLRMTRYLKGLGIGQYTKEEESRILSQKEKFKLPPPVYSFSEMKMLKSGSSEYHILGHIIFDIGKFDIINSHLKEEEAIFLQSIKDGYKAITNTGAWILGYSGIHRSYHSDTLEAKNMSYVAYFSVIIIIFLILILISLSLVMTRSGLLRTLNNALDRTGVTMTRGMLSKLMITKFPLWFLPIQSKKAQNIIIHICEKIRDEEISDRIKDNADQFWGSVGKSRFSKEAKTSWKVASRRTRRKVSLESQIEAIQKLTRIWEDVMTEKFAPLQTPESPKISPAKKEVLVQSMISLSVDPNPRDMALQSLISLLESTGFTIRSGKIKNLSLLKLRNLKEALNLLSSILPKGKDILLQKENLSSMLSENSRFMTGIFLEEEVIIRSELGLKIQAQVETFNPAEYSNILQGKQVLIVGLISINKGKKLKTATKALGATSPKFIHPKNAGMTKFQSAVTRKNIIIIFITLHNLHKYELFMKGNNIGYIRIHTTNQILFQERMVEWFK